MKRLSEFQRVHFVGIGGIGVSALAQWFLAHGARVSGSNLSEEPILALLQKRGAKIVLGPHRAKNIPEDAELLIYTLAAPKDNAERKAGRKAGIPEISYPEALGELTKEKFTIAVCGAHGKSTTAALAALMLVEAGFDPTAILGTKLKEFGGSNFRYGKSRYLVIEADEWRGAFWHYFPDIAIFTTIDREHLDFYKNFAGVRRGFVRFLQNLKPGGAVIANGDYPEIRKTIHSNILRNIGISKRCRFYSLRRNEAEIVRKILKIPGEHNVSNALAVLALADALKIPQDTALKAIGEYRGAWRRMEYRGRINGAKIYDDYGHHPTEIKATLKAARSTIATGGRLWCVFQPHQYQRLKALFRDFCGAFGDADGVILLPVYAVAGREHPSAFSANSEKLAAAIQRNGTPCEYIPTFRKAAGRLLRTLRRGDSCILMGAGDIVKIHKFLHTDI